MAVTSCSAPELADGPAQGSNNANQPLTNEAATLHELDLREVNARTREWRRSDPGAYRYTMTSTCDCDRDGSFQVRVSNGKAVHVESLSADAEQHRRYPGQSIDEMFAMFREAINEGGTARAAFDPNGRPTEFAISWDSVSTFTGRLSDFAPIAASPRDEHEEPTVLLVVTNQSYDDPTVHVTVAVGDRTFVNHDFAVGNQHRYAFYELPLPPGTHRIELSSDSGATRVEALTIEPDEPQYLTISYWNGDAEGDGPRLDYRTSLTPPAFA